MRTRLERVEDHIGLQWQHDLLGWQYRPSTMDLEWLESSGENADLLFGGMKFRHKRVDWRSLRDATGILLHLVKVYRRSLLLSLEFE